MNVNLLLLDFNNYFNRTIKKYSSVSDYLTNSNNYHWAMGGKEINFIPNDGVTTEQIIDYKEDWEPNYLLVTDLYQNIISRWFIIESVRTRGGQYKLTLKRDSVADYFNAVISSPCFIQKATVKSINDVCIFNSEGMQFNQIKKSEKLLKDKSGVGWLIGYFTKPDSDINIDVASTDFEYIRCPSLNQWEFKDYINNDYKYVTQKNMYISLNVVSSYSNTGDYRFNVENGTYTRISNATYIGRITVGTQSVPHLEAAQAFASYCESNKASIWNAYFATSTSHHDNDPLSSLNGRYIYFADTNAYYQIAITRSSLNNEIIEPAKNSAAEQAINGAVSGFNYNGLIYEYPISQLLIPNALPNTTLNLVSYNLRIQLTRIYPAAYTTKISSRAKKLSDAPYSMFAIPYGEIVLQGSGVSFTSLSSKEALNVASEIAKQAGTYVKDVQLLPYFPFRERLETGAINYVPLTENVDYNFIVNASQQNVGMIFYCPYSSFTFDITTNEFNVPNSVQDYKVENETSFYRLQSPNGSSQFDFKITKTGSFTKFNVDCTYKPFNPYIHVNPDWKKLYGNDFNDYRGLVCQGDFSVPVLNNEWIQYQINNKNYLNAFNRQTDSLELQYKYQRLRNILGAGVGALGGMTSGALAGSVAGGVGGAIAGGLIGGIASSVGGAIDINIADRLHQDQMDLRRDQFDYSLQNIQARPDTLAKVSAFDYNNKIFPIVERYESTEDEKQILKDKMQYEGMTIMKVGTLIQYLSTSETYLRGTMIKIENVEGDYHLINDIKNEIAMGIRAKE